MHECARLDGHTVYCKNYGTALETLQKLKNDPRFVRFLAETENHPEVNHLEITSFLILPIQRIPRYVLLLKVHNLWHFIP
jgi:hypothetical protein